MASARPDLRALRPEVHVLVPFTVEDGRLSSPEYDTDEFRAELATWFAPFGIEWRWVPVTIPTIGTIVDGLARRAADRPLVAFNLCDGSEKDEYPGPSVVDALTRSGIGFTGGDATFYRTSTAKLEMKRLFRTAGVATAPWRELVDPDRDIPALGAEVGYPAIVKLAGMSAGGGLSVTSVPASEAEALVQYEKLAAEGYLPWRPYAERFLAGREFTTLVYDAPWEPDGLATLCPVEMVYNQRVPPRERILFEGHRKIDPEGRPRGEGGVARCLYEPAPQALRADLIAFARRAYRAVRGNGYARVDIRLEEGTGAPHALEVNTNCELSRDAPTIAPALAAFGLPFEELIAGMLAAALARGRDPAHSLPAA